MEVFMFSGLSDTSTFYCTNSTINFILEHPDHSDNKTKKLSVTIDTDRLHLRSVERKEQDYEFYARLFGNEEVTHTFATGRTQTRKELEDRINNVWAVRWEKNNPYSAFVIEMKNKNTEEPIEKSIGHMNLITQVPSGQAAELAYLIEREQWGQRFAIEAASSVVKEYAPLTVRQGYTIGGKPLEEITATALPTNIASVAILKKLGMQKTGEEIRYGSLRAHYSIKLERQITKNYGNEGSSSRL